jgi:hypothetical protein
MNTIQDPRAQRLLTPAVVVGIAIIILGLLLMVDNLAPGVRLIHYAFRLWPLILVAIGAVKLRECQAEGRSCTSALMFMGIGGFLLLGTLGRGSLEDLFGPLILVAAGIAVITFALKKHRRVPPELQHSPSFVQGTAILSGFKRRLQSSSFKGGEMTAIFGGFDLDLRQVVMENDSARIDVFILFGGGEVKIPEHWDVMNHITAIAGGVEDKTSHIIPEGQARPQLVLTGTTLFGGLELRN